MRSKEERDRVLELRAQGLLTREIAERLGVPHSTVIRWCNPRLMTKDRKRARKSKYSKNRRCPKCGKRMSDTATVCVQCARADARFWTRDRIIRAVKEWAAERGSVPTITQWERSKQHPKMSSIRSGKNPPFHRWSEIVVAAGFKAHLRPKRRKLTSAQRAALRRELREEQIRAALGKEGDVSA